MEKFPEFNQPDTREHFAKKLLELGFVKIDDNCYQKNHFTLKLWYNFIQDITFGSNDIMKSKFIEIMNNIKCDNYVYDGFLHKSNFVWNNCNIYKISESAYHIVINNLIYAIRNNIIITGSGTKSISNMIHLAEFADHFNLAIATYN